MGNQQIAESDLLTIAEPEEVVVELAEETKTAEDKLDLLVEGLHQMENTPESREALRKLLAELL